MVIWQSTNMVISPHEQDFSQCNIGGSKRIQWSPGDEWVEHIPWDERKVAWVISVEVQNVFLCWDENTMAEMFHIDCIPNPLLFMFTWWKLLHKLQGILHRWVFKPPKSSQLETHRSGVVKSTNGCPVAKVLIAGRSPHPNPFSWKHKKWNTCWRFWSSQALLEVLYIMHSHMRTMVLVYLPNWASDGVNVGIHIPAPWFAYGI